MRTLTLILFTVVFYNCSVSQIINSNTKDSSRQNNKTVNTKYDFNICVTQGFSYNSNNSNFHYINLDLGYKFFKKQEIGICIGDNDMIWYGGYLRIHFAEDISIGCKIAKDDSHTDYLILNEISIGKDLIIMDNFYFRAEVFFSVRSKYPFGIKNKSSFNKGGVLFGFNYLL